VIGYAFHLHSQQWLDESIYTIQHDDSVIWKHWVWLWVPQGVKVDQDLIDSCIFLIDGGKNRSTPPSENKDYVKIGKFLSLITGSMFAFIEQIPNEHLVFKNDWKNSRTEDCKCRTEVSSIIEFASSLIVIFFSAIIALTWHHFLDYPDQPEWLLRFPMVKASLRAMDMISEFSETTLGGPKISRWGVLGGSKRGWVTWLLGAVDPERVKVRSRFRQETTDRYLNR